MITFKITSEEPSRWVCRAYVPRKLRKQFDAIIKSYDVMINVYHIDHEFNNGERTEIHSILLRGGTPSDLSGIIFQCQRIE